MTILPPHLLASDPEAFLHDTARYGVAAHDLWRVADGTGPSAGECDAAPARTVGGADA